MLSVLHRVLLTRDSLDIQLAAMKVVRQIVKSAQESLETRKAANGRYKSFPFPWMHAIGYFYLRNLKPLLNCVNHFLSCSERNKLYFGRLSD